MAPMGYACRVHSRARRVRVFCYHARGLCYHAGAETDAPQA